MKPLIIKMALGKMARIIGNVVRGDLKKINQNSQYNKRSRIVKDNQITKAILDRNPISYSPILKTIKNIDPYLPICSNIFITLFLHLFSNDFNLIAYMALGRSISTTMMSPKILIQFIGGTPLKY
jgi:hypothetical protein